MAGQPATKAEQLNLRMHELLLKESASDLELGQLRRDANSLLNASPNVAHMVLGFLAAIDGKESDTRSHFKAALRLSPDCTAYANYAQALMQLNLFSESLVASRKAYELDPGNLPVLDSLIGHCTYAGAVLEANRLMAEREALHPANPHELAQFVPRASALMAENGVKDVDVQALQEIASAVVREHHLRSWYTECFIQQDDEDCWASIWLHVRGTVEQVVDLNIEFAERLAVIEPPPHADGTVGYMFVTADRS